MRTPAAIKAPVLISMETSGRDNPAWNMNPTIIGEIIAPPRPTPTVNPVPDALTWVGNAAGKRAYIPTMPEFPKKPHRTATTFI
jgi:hypothetical protein